LAKKMGDLKAEALALSDLSNLFWKQGKYTNALQYGLESEKVFEQRGIDDLDYDFTLYVIGNVYLALDRYEEALQYFERALKMGEQFDFYNNLSDTYISLIDLYTEIGEYDLALSASNEATHYAELLNNNFLLMRAWLSIGRLQNLQENYQEAVHSLNHCLMIATPEFGDEFFLHQVYKELAHANAKLGNFEEAFRAYSRYDETKDSVFTAEADKRIAQLQTEYEVAAKEATISSQESELRQKEKTQILTIGFVVLLGAILIVLFRNYIQKRKLNDQLSSLNKDLTIKNVELDQRNAENELLLKEIHHRVKNNLEVVSSLLELQSAQIDDPDVQNAMQESQSRVQSMGIIHQKLYQSKNLASIEMRDYFVNLGEGILDSFAKDRQVTLDVEMEPLELDVDTAVPIGLIVNELLTNAMKYAFPNEVRGAVKISLRKEKDSINLLVSDNGVGKSQNSNGPTGFGTQLIELLTRQLDGRMVEENGEGTTVRFEFQKSKHR
ncbi:MAG: tetratricopeptide repeat protein, partial [Saprospiraceae bacterium]|nr:tetratricopeptide repeat protein [Saprospiraceae bacterium]